MFLSVRLCAEHITQLPSLNVKVTGQGHVVYPSIRVRSIHPERFSLNFTGMFFSVRWCAEHITQLLRDSRSQVKGFTLEFRVRSISPEPFGRFSLNFTQMFLSVRQCTGHMTQLPIIKFTGLGHVIFIKLHPNVPLSEMVCRTNDSATQTQGQGHTSRSWNLPLNFVSFKSPQPFVRFSLNITQMFLSEPMTQLCKLKVKVTLHGHEILRQGI